MDNFDIEKILKSTTVILAKIRFETDKKSTGLILKVLSEFFTKRTSDWNYNIFINKLINNQENCDIDLYQVYFDNILKDIEKTDNVLNINLYLPIISKVFKDTSCLFEKMEYKQLYDLLDMIHELPESLIKKDRWNNKVFWNLFVKPYRKKWDKYYLKSEEKLLK